MSGVSFDLIRYQTRQILKRWQADEKRLHKMFPHTKRHDFGELGPATEAARNLATAIAELEGVLEMSDHGLRGITRP